MNHKTKQEILLTIREEVKQHPIFAKAIIHYLEHIEQDSLDAFDAADNFADVARQQGRRVLLNDLVKLLSGGTA